MDILGLAVGPLLGTFVITALMDDPVHHRNGVNDDNRPENLELWVRPQPSGIRAEDALAWARMIVKRYGRELPPPTTLRARR